VTDFLPDLFDVLVFVAGLVLIFGLAFPSWRKAGGGLPRSAVIGMTVWLGMLGLALYLIFG
jgi:hypothetical protein